ncbi:MAG: isoprenylcysteine carboxylmethyltransferase family protein [Sphaerochaeta sp.]|nr:isoprenylcysteine carboxylmethyltransferase family protein [Sphaerochaeta sp.]
METTSEHYAMWGVALIWVILYSLILLFLPFYRKCGRKPKTAYLAFVIAFALEMFGIPFSLYFASWAFGIHLGEGVFWGHTLVNSIGHTGMYIGIVLMAIGLILIVSGWQQIYKFYWSKEKGEGKLVHDGIYRYIRHSQYTGLFLITLGMMVEWLTIPQLVMWPVMLTLYIRLAFKEEKDMLEEFGMAYRVYKDGTGMLFPKL